MLSPLFFSGTCVSAGTSTGAYYDYAPADWRTKQAGAADLPTLGAIPYGGSGSASATLESFESTPPIGTKAWDLLRPTLDKVLIEGRVTYRVDTATSGTLELFREDEATAIASATWTGTLTGYDTVTKRYQNVRAKWWRQEFATTTSGCVELFTAAVDAFFAPKRG